MTPNAAFEAVMPGRAVCVSFYRPDQVELAEKHCPQIMYDTGDFSKWRQFVRAGIDPADVPEWSRDDYYQWLDARIRDDGRWAVIPDRPGAPSQMSDALINDWPFGQLGAPVWHMNGPLSRLARLCERFERVCLGWVAEIEADNHVGSVAYHARMDEVADFFGNTWPIIHMLRGVAVARDYPFRKRRQHFTGSKRASL
jgi:hypothetical protein